MQLVVKRYTRPALNHCVIKLFKVNGHTWFSELLHILSISVHCILVCVCVLVCTCTRVSLTPAPTSDCWRKGQQPDMAIMFVFILRTSLCVSGSNSQQNNKPSLRQVSHGSYLWSSHIPSLSQKAYKSHHTGRYTDLSLRIWQWSSIPSTVVM